MAVLAQRETVPRGEVAVVKGLPSGKVIESSGELVVFADVLRAMRRDARSLTIAAAALVPPNAVQLPPDPHASAEQ